MYHDPESVRVAAPSIASEIGAEVLAAGGDAIDAAVAVSFSIGVLEPWMSGLGGGGLICGLRGGSAQWPALLQPAPLRPFNKQPFWVRSGWCHAAPPPAAADCTGALSDCASSPLTFDHHH